MLYRPRDISKQTDIPLVKAGHTRLYFGFNRTPDAFDIKYGLYNNNHCLDIVIQFFSGREWNKQIY